MHLVGLSHVDDSSSSEACSMYRRIKWCCRNEKWVGLKDFSGYVRGIFERTGCCIHLGRRRETAEASVRMVDTPVAIETGLDYFWILFDDGQSQFDILLLVLSMRNFTLKTQRFGSCFCFLLAVTEGPFKRDSLSATKTTHVHNVAPCL